MLSVASRRVSAGEHVSGVGAAPLAVPPRRAIARPPTASDASNGDTTRVTSHVVAEFHTASGLCPPCRLGVSSRWMRRALLDAPPDTMGQVLRGHETMAA